LDKGEVANGGMEEKFRGKLRRATRRGDEHPGKAASTLI
jgi:hypothetical protein